MVESSTRVTGTLTLLQRFVGYLNHINRVGDVMGESRGKVEDFLLKESYSNVFAGGVWTTSAHTFQSALTSRELKLKPKTANITGLQLADLLGHPIKQWVLKQHGHTKAELAPFAQRLMAVVESKFNRDPSSGGVHNYGTVLYPRQ